jgi:hypothetical protein
MPSQLIASNGEDEDNDMAMTKTLTLDTNGSRDVLVTEGSLATNLTSELLIDASNSDIVEEGSLDGSSLQDGSIQDAESNSSVGLLDEDVRPVEKGVTTRPRRARGSISTTESRRPSRGAATRKSQADLSRIENSSLSVDKSSLAQKTKSATKGAATNEKESKADERHKETEASGAQTDRGTKTPSTDAEDPQSRSRKWNRLKTAIHTSYLLSTDRIAKNFEVCRLDVSIGLTLMSYLRNAESLYYGGENLPVSGWQEEVCE